jgi:hypothetical protein
MFSMSDLESDEEEEEEEVKKPASVVPAKAEKVTPTATEAKATPQKKAEEVEVFSPLENKKVSLSEKTEEEKDALLRYDTIFIQ